MRDLALAHQHWLELAPWAEQLQAQWPCPARCHRLLLDEGHVTLDLWFGDINERDQPTGRFAKSKVDAWFLDGFAPAKNPDMWTQNLFNAMARLARRAARWRPLRLPVLSAAVWGSRIHYAKT